MHRIFSNLANITLTERVCKWYSMLWPSLVVVLCGAIFLRLEMRRRRLTLCGHREPRGDFSAPDTTGPAGHTQAVTSQTTGAPVGGHFRPAGRATNEHSSAARDMIGRRLPASHGQ